jgi:hypothetical protein
MHRFFSGFLAAALGAAACYEAPREARPAGVDAGAADGSSPSPPLGADDTGPTLRLTRDEYDRTVRDLFGLSTEGVRPSEGFPEDDRVDGLPYGTAVTALHVEKERAAAERIATEVLELVAFVCLSIPDDQACGQKVLETFAPRAFRRPLTDHEWSDLTELYRSQLRVVGRREALRAVLEALLFSPQFLLKEPQQEPQAPRWDSYTRASRLSYFLTGSMPDDALFSAAVTGKLATKDGVRSEAIRLLDGTRGRAYLPELYRQLFRSDRIAGVARDARLYPGITPSAATDLARGFDAFLRDTILGTSAASPGNFDGLFRGKQVYFTATTAPLFGIPGAFDVQPRAVLFEPELRGGVLLQPGFLALQARFDGSDPIHRGVFVRRQILCGELADPPPNIPVQIPVATDATTQTTRERFSQHTDPSHPACYSCHQDIDPIGFAFEGFDGIGRSRTTENVAIVDTTGWITHTKSSDGPVTNAHEMSERFAASADVAHCFARHTWLWALRRPRTVGDDARVDRRFATVLLKGDATTGDLPGFRALALAIATDDAFLGPDVAGAPR